MGSYVPATSSEQLEMLEAIGLRDFRELYGDVPEEMYLRAPLDIPEGLSELEVSRKLRAMAAKNHVFSTVLRGAGAYDHYIPSVVSYIPAKEEFLTAYTPYQAEMSQGLLQSIFEYQTMICRLTGMEVSNASVYDGATAAAEAAAMCRDRKRRVTLVSAAAHPDTIVMESERRCGWFPPGTGKPTRMRSVGCSHRMWPPSMCNSPTFMDSWKTRRRWDSWSMKPEPCTLWVVIPFPWPF